MGAFFACQHARQRYLNTPDHVCCEGCCSLSLFSGEIVPGLSPAINEVTPGWVLSDAQYSVLRNSDKFAKRNRSKHTEIPSEVIRKEIVEMILDAREILRNVDPSSSKHQDAVGAPIYTDKECSGIGKNYMKESSRVKAIDTYTFFAKHYALMGMYRQLQSGVLLANIFDPARYADCKYLVGLLTRF